MNYYRMQNMYYQIEGKPEKSIEACNAAIKFMETKPHFLLKVRYGEFALYRLQCCLLSRQFEKGMEETVICGKYYNKGTNNWFKYKQYEFLLLMQTLRYEEALTLYRDVTSQERFETQNDLNKERWKIFGIYIRYVTKEERPIFHRQANKESRDKQTKEKKTITKITEVSSSLKDKKGLNVAIIIMNILLLLEDNNIKGLRSQAKSLEFYRYKYLSGKFSKQSFLLLRLINVMIDNDFDLTLIKKKAKAIERKLAVTSPGAAEIFECVQILPPDEVWSKMKKILALLEKALGSITPTA
jgi:hypothetical protein